MTSTTTFDSSILFSDIDIRKIVSDIFSAKRDFSDFTHSPANLKKAYDLWRNYDEMNVSKEERDNNIDYTIKLTCSYFQKVDAGAAYLKKLSTKDEFAIKMKSYDENSLDDLQNVMCLFCECAIIISKQDEEKRKIAFASFPPRIADLKYLSTIAEKINKSISELHISEEQEFIMNVNEAVLRSQTDQLKYFVSDENRIHIFPYLESSLGLEPFAIIKFNDPYYIVPQAEITSEAMWSILREYPGKFMDRFSADLLLLENEKSDEDNSKKSSALDNLRALQKKIQLNSEKRSESSNLSHIKEIQDYKVLLSDKAKDHLISLLKSESPDDHLIAVEALWVMGERFNGSSPFQFMKLLRDIAEDENFAWKFLPEENHDKIHAKNKFSIWEKKLKDLWSSLKDDEMMDESEVRLNSHPKHFKVKKFLKELEEKASIEHKFRIHRLADRYEFYVEEHKEYLEKSIADIRLGNLIMSTFPADIIIQRIKNHSEEVGILTAQAIQLVAHPERMEIFKSLKDQKENLMIDFIKICISFSARYNDTKLCKYVVENLVSPENYDDLKEVFSESLISSVKNGNIELTDLFIDTGVNLNITNEYGFTPLMIAAEVGSDEVVKGLLKLNEKSDRVKISTTNHQGYNSLMIAAQKGHLKIVEILQEKGANLNVLGEDGSTALMLAVQGGHNKIVQLLLDKGAKYQILNNSNQDALMLAVINNNTLAVKILLEKGADPNVVVRDYKGEANSLMLAIRKDYLEIIKELLGSKEMNLDYASRDDGFTALMKAAQNGHVAAVRMLLEKGANPNIFDDRKYNAFKLAQNQEIKDLLKIMKNLQDTLDLIPALKNKISVRAYLDQEKGTLNPLLSASEKEENIWEILSNAMKSFVGRSAHNKDLLTILVENSSEPNIPSTIKINLAFEDKKLLKAMKLNLSRIVMKIFNLVVR